MYLSILLTVHIRILFSSIRLLCSFTSLTLFSFIFNSETVFSKNESHCFASDAACGDGDEFSLSVVVVVVGRATSSLPDTFLRRSFA